MRIEGIAIGMCRQHSQQTATRIEHQRVILKAVAMVIHVATVEEERAVLRLCHETVPFVGLCSGVSDYFEHPTYFIKSS